MRQSTSRSQPFKMSTLFFYPNSQCFVQTQKRGGGGVTEEGDILFFRMLSWMHFRNFSARVGVLIGTFDLKVGRGCRIFCLSHACCNTRSFEVFRGLADRNVLCQVVRWEIRASYVLSYCCAIECVAINSVIRSREGYNNSRSVDPLKWWYRGQQEVCSLG